MNARKLFELRGSPAPAVEPPPTKTKPTTKPSPKPGRPERFPDPFRPMQPGKDPMPVTRPAKARRTESRIRADRLVNQLLT